MEAMRIRLEEVLRGVTTDGLKNNESLRVKTKAAVDAAIKSLPSLDM
jgi:hypothetical protein